MSAKKVSAPAAKAVKPVRRAGPASKSDKPLAPVVRPSIGRVASLAEFEALRASLKAAPAGQGGRAGA
ncbi:MAG: hypothetical protein PHR35_22460, partial [Kiritimatiellae bacterium]|nr:hypothetical protein [Kiritimatiellia bacterium]